MNAQSRKRTNVTLDADLIERARELDINLSRAAEEGLRQAVRSGEREKWVAENRDAMEAQNKWVRERGLPLEHLQVLKV